MAHPQQHATWIAQARAHWKEHRPQMYARLLEAGQLEEALQDAATSTSSAMQNLMHQGATWDEAWEQTRELYLFLPQEAEADEKAPQTPGYRAHRGLMVDLGSLTMPGEKIQD